MKNPKHKIGDFVIFFCKYKNQNVTGEIINIRQAHLNWDYQVRYQIYVDSAYLQWVAEEYIIDKVKK